MGRMRKTISIDEKIDKAKENFEKAKIRYDAAAKELEEELGIKIAEKDLTDLSGLAGCNQGIYLSPGASDETMRFFSFTRDVTEEEMASMNGRCTGLISEGEQITLKIVPLDDLVTVADAKTIVAYALYQKYLADWAWP